MPCFISQRLIALKNYDSKCGNCGVTAKHVHHKDVNRNNNELENLIPLCISCHNATHSAMSQKVSAPKVILKFDVLPEEKERLEAICEDLKISKIEFLRRAIEDVEQGNYHWVIFERKKEVKI